MTAQLHVSTDFPGANACVLDLRETDGIPEVHFAASPKGGPEALWFCLDVTPPAAPAPASIRCVLHFADTLLGGGRAKGFHPVYRTLRQDWQRVETVSESREPDGRLLLSWTVPGNEGTVRVALCYPYGEAERDALIRDLAPVFRCDTIGVTSEGRPLLRLATAGGGEGSDRPGLFCLARQHAGETPGSWMLDGFLRGLAAAGDRAPLTWAVPFADPDGVCAGRYGKDSFPWDFNRAWGFEPGLYGKQGSQPMRYEVRCIQSDLARWMRRCRPRAVLDFHAPGMCETEGIYCFLSTLGPDGQPTEPYRPWCKAFEQALGGEAAAPFARSGHYHSRWNTARVGDYTEEALKLLAFSFETPYGRSPRATRESYQEAGSRLAEAACSLFL